MRVRWLALVLLLCTLPQAARAQGDQSCEIVPIPGNPNRGTTIPDHQMMFLGGGALLVCEGGTRIRSDSLIWAGGAGLVEFIGRVVYTDSVKTMTAAYAQYVGRERRVSARDNVVVTDRKTGSSIRGPYIEYYQASDTRPEPMIFIYSGRPRAVLIRSARDTVRTDTTVIVSDQMEIHGERLFIGRGNVVITRGETQAYGNEGQLDQVADSMRLAGAARIVSKDYKLHGDTISALLTATDDLREVTARHDAKLESEELQAEAPALRILFEEGAVHRLIAVGARAAAPNGSGTDTDNGATRQALAVSSEFRLTADSIDALAPRQQLDRVVAVGLAFGERLMPDSISAARPSAAPTDWMRGDTILATFVKAPEMSEDTATQRDRVLETITATGTARSIYAQYDQEDPAAKPAVSYVLAHRIAVRLRDGVVAEVNAQGRDGKPVHGLYLQPADSTGAARRDGRTAGTVIR